jgi:hypothetical protein
LDPGHVAGLDAPAQVGGRDDQRVDQIGELLTDLRGVSTRQGGEGDLGLPERSIEPV